MKNRDPDGGAKPSKPPGGEAAGSVRKDIKHRHVLPTVLRGRYGFFLFICNMLQGEGSVGSGPFGTNTVQRASRLV